MERVGMGRGRGGNDVISALMYECLKCKKLKVDI